MKETVVCLGPRGSDSERAAKALVPNGELLLAASFPAAAEILACGNADSLVLPIENSIRGSVRQNLDLLQRNPDLFAVKDILLPDTLGEESDPNIADETENRTQFLLVKKGRRNLPAVSQKVFVCVSLAHRPGALLRFLQVIDSFGLNLTKISSRPIPALRGQYRFFLEFEGNIADNVVQYALESLEQNSRQFRLLGAY